MALPSPAKIQVLQICLSESCKCQSIICYSICAQQIFYYLNGQGADLALHFFYLSHHSLDLIMSYSGPEV